MCRVSVRNQDFKWGKTTCESFALKKKGGKSVLLEMILICCDLSALSKNERKVYECNGLKSCFGTC